MRLMIRKNTSRERESKGEKKKKNAESCFFLIRTKLIEVSVYLENNYVHDNGAMLDQT